MNNGLSTVAPPLNWTPQGGFSNTPAPSVHQDSGNWLTHLLPTIGSVVGGLAAPATGGLSLLAMPALSGLGSVLGQGAENLFEGKDITNDLGQSALEGAGGGLIGGIAGGVAKKGLSALGGVAQKGMATQEAAAQGANDIASQQALRDAWMGVKPGLRSRLNLGGNAQTIRELGGDPTNPQHFFDTGNSALDALGNVRDTALANSGPVNMTGFNDIIHGTLSNPEAANVLGAYKNARGMPTNSPAAKIYSALQNAGGGVGGLEAADPNVVRELVSRVQGMAADAKPVLNAQGVIDPTQKAVYGAYNNIANQLKKTLYNRPEVDQAFTQMKGNLRAEDVGGNQALADKLNDTLNNATTAQDVLNPMSGFINMQRLGKEGLTAAQDAGSAAAVRQVKAQHGVSSSKIATDVPGMQTPSAGGGLFGMSPGVQAMAGIAGMPFTGGLSAVAAIPEALKLASKVPPQAIQGAVNIASKGAPLITSGGANLLTHAPDMSGGGGGNMDLSGMTPPVSQTPQMGEISPIQGLATVAAMRSAMNGDMSGIGNLQQILAPKGATSAMNASNALHGLVGAYQQAGGGQGGIGGRVSELASGITGGPVQGYNQQKESVAAQIAAALGEEPASVLARLPNITDSPESAQTKIKNLTDLIQSHYTTATQTGYQTEGTTPFSSMGATPATGLAGLGF